MITNLKKDLQTKQKEWIERCLVVHNGLYDYSKSVFTGADDDITITCKKHDLDFNQRAGAHKRGNRCPQCAKEWHKAELRARRCWSHAQFVEKVDKIHNGLYDYSDTLYTAHADRIVVKCKIHGAFSIGAGRHVAGDGCSTCSRTKKGNIFIEKATDKYTFDVFLTDIKERNPDHLNKYEYDESSYSVTSRKIRIKCLACTKRLGTDQWFYQLRRAHKRGAGCNYCGREKLKEAQTFGKEEILRRLEETHQGKFEFIESDETNWRLGDFVKRKCNDCGDVRNQKINSLIAGKGCGKCSGTDKHTTESFIEKSKMLHGPDVFDYSRTVYKDNSTKVTLICTRNRHVFETIPYNNLMRKGGCPECSRNSMASFKEIAWKQHLGIDPQHWNIRENIDGKRFNFDAKVGNVIYEFYGSYWHGDPRVFPPTQLIYGRKIITAKEAYDKTIAREDLIRNHGYEVISMWEYDWDMMNGLSPVIRVANP